MTTMAGNSPERFSVEILSVVHNYLPKQDLILFKSDDPKIQTPGIWRGMSGSPVYIDDKLVCAISYTYAFDKQAVGGCTPLQYMLAVGDSHRRVQPATTRGDTRPTGAVQTVTPAAATLEDWRRLTPRVDVADAFAALGPAHKSWIASAPLPPPIAKPAPVDGAMMTAGVPLSIAGFSAPAFAEVAKIFADSDLLPMRAGGAAGGSSGAATASGAAGEGGPDKLVMGGSISVELMRGDMSMAGTGTVTYLDRNEVLAFGHPMFQTGESYAPIATATVHTVIASAQAAFVMATPIREVGSLVEDRQAAIAGDLSLRSPMIPLDIEVSSVAGTHKEGGSFHVELLNSKFMTPALAAGAVGNAIQYYLPDRDDVTARIESKIALHQGAHAIEPIEFVDYLYANDGAGSIMGAVRGLRALVPLMLNPYEALTIDDIHIKVELKFEANFGEVKEASVPTGDLIAGERNLIHVRLGTYDGRDFYDDVPLDVPANLAGSIVQVELSSGDSAKLDGAPPVDLPSLLAIVRKLLPGDVWAATISPADDGVALEGKLVRDLPASALDKLHPESHTQRAAVYKPIARTLSPTHHVIAGGTSMLVRVRAR